MFKWRIQIPINQDVTLLNVFGNWGAKWSKATGFSSNYRENSEWQKCSDSGTSINKTHEKHALLQRNRHVWENTKQNDYKSQSSCTCFYLTEEKTTPTSSQPKTSVSQLVLYLHSGKWIKNSLSQNSFEPPVSSFLHLPQDTGHVFQHTPSPEFSGHILNVQDLLFLFFSSKESRNPNHLLLLIINLL